VVEQAAERGGNQATRRGVRRRAALACAGGGVLGAVAACGQTGGPAAPQQSAGPVTLRYGFYASAPEAEIWKRVAADFSRENGRITVEPYHTNPDGDHFQRMYTLLAANSEPEIMMWTTKELKGGAVKDVFYPLDGLIKSAKHYKKEDVFPIEWEKNVFRGKLLALALTHSPLVIYYNKDVFQKAGVPEPPHTWTDPGWTWDGLLDSARKLTKGAGSPDASFGYDNQDSWWSVQPFMWSNGGDYLSTDDSKVQIDTPPVVEAFQWVADLRLRHKVNPTPADMQGQGGTTGMFAAGRLAMFSAITSTAPTLVARPDLRWDLAPMPHRRTQAWTRNPQLNITISKNNGGKYAGDAWLALEYLAGEPGQQAMAELHRGLPANKKVAYSEAWLTPGSAVDWRVFIEAAEKHSHREHEIIKFPEMNKLIGDAYTKELLTGNVSAKQMAESIKPQLEELIRENTQLMNAGR
jgi:multiple sugar transport system substrate-binding protein